MNIDQQLHDFEEMGTRDDCIRERPYAQEHDAPHVDRLDMIRQAAQRCDAKREQAL